MKKNTQHKFGIEPKKYGNKDGDFVTGIDITKKEEAEKREERARRFGLEESQNDNNQPNQQVDIASLYKSLGIHEADVPKDERGIRLEAVHIRGVRNMSTKDVFEYFQEFAPSNVEWIEDNSCNVVWADGLSAARALYKLSRSYEDVCAATAGGVSVGARTLPDITKGVLGRDRRRTKQEEHHDEEEEDDSSSSDSSQDNPTSSPGGGEGGGSEDGGGGGDREEEEGEEEKEGDPSDNDGGAADCQPADQPQQSPEEVDQQQPMEEGEVEDGEVDDEEEGGQAENKKAEEPEEVPPRPAEPKSDGELSSSDDDEADRAESEEKKNNNVNCPEGGIKSPAVGFTNHSIDVSADSNEIQWPPGKWRLGKSCLQANRLFMRYATKADRKLPGAEKRSQYYMKYGNPNYGGLRGLISNSRKRKIRSVKSKDDVNDSRGHKNDEGHRRKNSSGLDTLDNSDLSDSDSSCSEIEPASRVSPPATKHRMMRMYADDIEEELKAKRSGRSRLAQHRMGLKLSQYGGAGGASLVKDARQLISRSDKSHHHHHHHHQYSRIHDDDEEEEDIEDDDGDGDDLGSRHHRFSSSVSPYNTKSDLRAKLERKRMRLSSPSSSSSSALSSSNAALSSASSNYLRLKIEVLD